MRRSRLSLVVALALTTSAAVVALPTAASAAPAPATPSADVPVQLLAMNDFHGRISETTAGDSQLFTGVGPGPDKTAGTADDGIESVGGAAHIATTVNNARSAFIGAGGTDASSLFVGAGDLISASPFNSSAFKDEPTIEVLNAMGLDVSSVGNHEFDRGTEELRRISGATDGTYTDDVTACEGIVVGSTGCFGTGEHAFDGADFPYLAANVISKTTQQPMLPPYQVFNVGGGKKVGLIGVVTDTTPTIVAGAGVADVTFIDEAEAVNRWVPELQRQGVQAIGVLVHEGGTNAGADGKATADSKFANGCDKLSGPVVDINNAVVPAVDLIISAHSHQAYNCMLTDSAGQPRLVTQAGYYGRLVSDIRLTLDGTTGDVVRYCSAGYEANNLPVYRSGTGDPEVASIVQYWTTRAAETGNVVVGSLVEAAARAKNANGTENRGAESRLGNLVAQAQLEALVADPAHADPAVGAPTIAFMNPGGLRADIDAGAVTYAEAFAVQPFSNSVNSITLTGTDIRGLLEQQFVGGGRTTQLILGTSNGFRYQYDASRPYGDKVDPASITLNGTAIVPTQKYRVVANSFLINGGDSFTSFTKGTGQATGPMDVDTAVSFFKAHNPTTPPAADHGVPTPSSRPADPVNLPTAPVAPVTTVDADPGLESPVCDATATISKATPTRGESVTVTGAGFAPNQPVTATLADRRVLGTATADATGAVTVAFRVPVDLPAGQQTVTLTSTSGEKASTTFTLGTVGSDVKTVVTALITKLLAWLRGR
ncbi:bifunctional metallophosphatase/5'-nucleotidase [Blastococcus sp. CT_GayMR16]|uniref:bifunctional metallophosphatase/5'-nucleotidase n=1 Tax=Blastococcus sp. CT_GayMR16 TaxID=2559607 RepID=UPI0010743FCB|nr:bifunctional metallophosphatase/5'-nucleotidase [Blastococcus sp. CT_GayMR16]TFV89097.1 bifunctional metallophosphatase/5'-nucleotidase [Blastococcus sp. CT_GayMR16]